MSARDSDPAAADREAWAAAAVEALRSVVVENKRKGDPVPLPRAAATSIERPRITAKDWLRIREQRALDAAYTTNAAASIALARLIAKNGGK